MTAQQVYEYALALMDCIGENGKADEDTAAGYAGKAPRLLDMLQRELATAEGKTAGEITSLSAALTVSDDTAARVMPFGLAAKLALADNDMDKYSDYAKEYERLKRTIPAVQTDIADDMAALSGFQTGAEWG